MNLLVFIKKAFVLLGFFLLFFATGLYFYNLFKNPFHDIVNHLILLQRYYPEDILLKAGNHLTEPKSRKNHFLNFPQEKKSGVIRVGVFGASHAFGAETYKKASYPFQLQKLFDEHFPFQKVEVLNFGMGGHGFQQQFFVWEKYAKLYEIDYILYGPRGLVYLRDLSFLTDAALKSPFPFPKSRFVLLQGGKKGIKLVYIKGTSFEDKYKNYYSLIPSVTALHYDKRAFQLWEYYLPFFKKELKNSFYYFDLPESVESPKINQILLEKMRKDFNKKMLLFTDSKKSFHSYLDKGALYNLNLFDPLSRKNFLYKVFTHKSSLGNELVAAVYFNALIGNKEFYWNIFNCYLNPVPFSVVEKQLNLQNVKRILIGAEDISIGEMRVNASDHHYKSEGESSFQNKPENIKSLIGFSRSSVNGFGWSPYFPLPFDLNEKSRVYIEFLNGKKTLLTHVKPVDRYGKMFNVYLNSMKWKNRDVISIYFPLEDLSLDLKTKLLQYKSKKIFLKINDYVLGELLQTVIYRQPSLVLKPKQRHTFLIMGPMHPLKARDLPSSFPLYVHYVMEGGSVLKSRIPEWNCLKEKKKYKLFLPNFEPIKNKYTDPV